MLRYFLALIILLHGIIHMMGFAKAFHYGNIKQLKKEIPKPIGLAWLLTSLLFIVSVFLLLLKLDAWLITGIIAVVLSQYLILRDWDDAKYGSLPNFIILLGCIILYP